MDYYLLLTKMQLLYLLSLLVLITVLLDERDLFTDEEIEAQWLHISRSRVGL